MESRNLLPQNTRMMANLLSFSGGALDVFCHMYYHSFGCHSEQEYSPVSC